MPGLTTAEWVNMLLKGALHVHSTCSDGAMRIAEVVEVYSSLGFDFIALTDHDFLLREGCYDRQLADLDSDLMIFKGVEMTVFEKGYVHVVKIDGEKEALHVFCHPSELALPMEKVLDRIVNVANRLPLDAVEVTSKGFYTPEYDIDEIPFVKVATDDAHSRMMCGRAWVEMDCRRDKDAILRAVKGGDFLNCFISSNGA